MCVSRGDISHLGGGGGGGGGEGRRGGEGGVNLLGV